jgi:replicative DNA helicase
MEKIEYLILRNLIFNEEFLRKVLPFLKEEYFEDESQKILFQAIKKFVDEYNKKPTKEILCIEVENLKELTQEQFNSIVHLINTFEDVEVEFEWLINTVESWCQDRALYLAIMETVHKYESDGGKERGSIPSILQDALAVSFDNHIGHDYLEDYEQRYEFHHRKEERVSFGLEYFDKITKGGLSPKTLTIALAGTGVGKSLFMCHFASSVLLQGRNVLYITLEMAEEKIAERIDANLLNVSLQDLKDLPKSMFESKVQGLSKKTQGTLIIKEYPTASAHAGHFRSLLNDLALKKSFHPDIIFIDYLNICSSSRYKAGSNVNTYTFVKAIAEEIRGLAVEFNVPVVSATQTTRSGYGNSDPELTDTSESFGLPATADLMFALISSEELEEMGQITVKQLKNRDNDRGWYKKFMLGIDRSKMRLYDVEQSAQNGVHDSGTKEEEYEFKENDLSKIKSKFGSFNFE